MASGTLTCSYGSVSKSISVNVGMGDAQSAHTVADFESGLNNLTASDGVTLSRVTDYTSVARGTGSLKAMWNDTGTDGFTISVPAADASSMKHLTLWAHSRNTAGTLTAVFADAEGNELTSPLSAATGNSWKQLTASVPDGAQQFTGLQFDKSGTGSGGSALYLDQIVLSADHAVTNTDAPSVKLNTTSATVSIGTNAALSGTATMENGKKFFGIE